MLYSLTLILSVAQIISLIIYVNFHETDKIVISGHGHPKDEKEVTRMVNSIMVFAWLLDPHFVGKMFDLMKQTKDIQSSWNKFSHCFKLLYGPESQTQKALLYHAYQSYVSKISKWSGTTKLHFEFTSHNVKRRAMIQASHSRIGHLRFLCSAQAPNSNLFGELSYYSQLVARDRRSPNCQHCGGYHTECRICPTLIHNMDEDEMRSRREASAKASEPQRCRFTFKESEPCTHTHRSQEVKTEPGVTERNGLLEEPEPVSTTTSNFQMPHRFAVFIVIAAAVLLKVLSVPGSKEQYLT